MAPLQWKQNLDGFCQVQSQKEHIQVNGQQSNLVTAHILKSAVNLVDVTNENLDGTLKTFWELESLGIKPRTLYEEFQEQISFTKERHEVHLPWKTPHSLLPDNCQLSRKRQENLLESFATSLKSLENMTLS